MGKELIESGKQPKALQAKHSADFKNSTRSFHFGKNALK